MALSRQFKALGRIGALFAAVWGGIGTAVSMVAGGPFLPSLLTYGVMFGAVGGISGVTTALLVARAERGRRLTEVATWRVSVWGFLGGFAPAGLFSALATTLGSYTLAGVVPLLVLGLISGGVGGVISASGAVAAKRAALGEGGDRDRLSAP